VANAWLFIKGSYSVRLIRTGRKLLVLGPGTQRRAHAPDSDDAADSLHRQIEADLRREGWVFEGYGIERRCSPDRRRFPRWTERRQYGPWLVP
jgi:hypothetical protein